MNKTKTADRLKNAFAAFSADEFDARNAPLTVADRHAVTNASLAINSQKAERCYTLFKRLCLFFPGVLMLHIASISFVIFYNEIGMNFWVLFWFAAGSFMTWAGIGDLRNRRHLLVALPTVAIGLIVGLLQSFFPPNCFQFLFAMAVPLSFVTSILTKSAINSLEDDEDSLTKRNLMR